MNDCISAQYTNLLQVVCKEALDMELRVEAAKATEAKKIPSRWMPSHRELTQARDDREPVDIKTNDLPDLPDKLAQKGTKLPI